MRIWKARTSCRHCSTLHGAPMSEKCCCSLAHEDFDRHESLAKLGQGVERGGHGPSHHGDLDPHFNLRSQALWALSFPVLKGDPGKFHRTPLRWVQAVFSIAMADSLDSVTGRVAAHQTKAIPARNEPTLANCALDKPHTILGLRRTNSTRKRAIPVGIRYWQRIEPTPWGLVPRLQSHRPISRPAASS